MATYNKINAFAEDLCKKVHNLGSDALTIALTNKANTPTSSSTTLGGLTQIAYTNFSGSRVPTITSCVQTSGVAKLILADITLTGVTATTPGFAEVVMYNDTAASDQLICWWEYNTTDTTLAVGETFTVDFDASTGVLTVG